ncbi:protein of unknown function [Xenorhabdus doucetiae]|uniref:Uncharacterized protein n=1 Tax=Xenorhabdus doucetiae TaxID=351671 RepID=A0A068QVI1_9GAMM|nr:protein of unknown function [Xenorhabdus doucetiae]
MEHHDHATAMEPRGLDDTPGGVLPMHFVASEQDQPALTLADIFLTPCPTAYDNGKQWQVEK